MKHTLHKQLNLVVSVCLVIFIPVTSHAANVTANVDYNNPRQTIEGFGASVTWVANDLDAFSPAKQTQILDLLYSTSQPSAGLSWVRVGSFLSTSIHRLEFSIGITGASKAECDGCNE